MVEVYLQYPDYSTPTGAAVESLGMCANREVRECISKDAKKFWGDVVVSCQGNGTYTLCVNTSDGPKPIKGWFYFTRNVANG